MHLSHTVHILLMLTICRFTYSSHDTHSVDTSNENVHIQGSTDNSGSVSIMGTPTHQIQYFHFKNTDGGRVKFVFMDFYLSPNSTLKIYDGVDSTSQQSTFKDTDRPIFISTGSDVLMVYKSYSHDPDHRHYEFAINKFNFIFTFYYGHAHNAPSKGACGAMHIDIANEGFVAANTLSTYDDPTTVDCVWVNAQVHTELVIAVKMSHHLWDQQSALQVHIGSTSEGGRAFSYSKHPATGIILYRISQGFFHVYLSGEMHNNDSFKLGFAETESRALELLEYSLDSEDEPSSCPYKTCHQGTCALYWDSCDGVDPSCEGIVWESQQYCADGIRCYDASVDVCDGFNDCALGADEEHCHGEEEPKSFWSTTGWKIAVGVFVFFMVCGGGGAKAKKKPGPARSPGKPCKPCVDCSKCDLFSKCAALFKPSASTPSNRTPAAIPTAAITSQPTSGGTSTSAHTDPTRTSTIIQNVTVNINPPSGTTTTTHTNGLPTHPNFTTMFTVQEAANRGSTIDNPSDTTTTAETNASQRYLSTVFTVHDATNGESNTDTSDSMPPPSYESVVTAPPVINIGATPIGEEPPPPAYEDLYGAEYQKRI